MQIGLVFLFLLSLVACTDAVPDIAQLRSTFSSTITFENEVIVNGEKHIATPSTVATLNLSSKVSEVSIGEGLTCEGLPWYAKANSYPLSLSAGGGKKFVSYRFKINGLSSECVTESVFVDLNAPVASLLAINVGYVNGSQKYFSTLAPNLTIAASDATEMKITNDATCTGGAWETYSTSKLNWALSSSTDGTHTISASFRNLSGLESSCISDTAILDTTAPDTSGLAPTLQNSVIYTAKNISPLMNWTPATDTGSGVLKYQLSLGTSFGGTEIRDWTDAGASTNGQLVGLNLLDQNYYLNIRVVDNLQNTSAWQSLAFSVQTVAPALTLNTTSPSSVSTPSITVSNIYSDYTVRIFTDAACTNEIMTVGSTGTSMPVTLPTLFIPGVYSYYAQSTSSGGASACSAGVAYEYDPPFLQITKLADNTPRSINAISAAFGTSVAISEDQTTLVTGAANESSGAGAVYIYIKSGGAWTLQQKLNGVLSGDLFGQSLAISGDTLVVGAPSHPYDATEANALTNAGAAYIYFRSGGTWTLQKKLVGTGTNGRMSGDFFGVSVGISGDSVVVGAKGQKYDANGSNLLTDAGAAFVFARASTVWTFQQKLVGQGTNGRLASDIFGSKVAISGDSIVVGAPGHGYDETGTGFLTFAGAAFVFTRTAGVWSLQQKLAGAGTVTRVASDTFGYSVAIENDSIAIGAPGQDTDATNSNSVTDAGAAYIYSRTGATWTLEQKIVGMGTNGRKAADSFGSSVSISQGRVAVGAKLQDYDAAGAALITNAGAAYIFKKQSSSWDFSQKIVALGTNARVAADNFGASIALQGLTLAVGALGQDYDSSGANNVTEAGATFIYSK
ncbi:FG-GAP repeat protein [Bdellovibrio sp. HCB2-146]|uniref:FG-GAP repeat protein n=1 Tax=Bdellovibrio sp. HCB2-146 TaxID=3394362 RepID=UPI0039BD83EA